MKFFLFAFITNLTCKVYISIIDIIILPFIRVHGFWLHVLVRLPTVRYIWFTFVYILKRNSLYLVCLHIRICMKTLQSVVQYLWVVFLYLLITKVNVTHTHTHTHARTHAHSFVIATICVCASRNLICIVNVKYRVSSLWSIEYRQCEI